MVKPDIWKDVQGYNGKYQVSYAGEIRRVYDSGKTRTLHPFKKAESGRKIYRDRLMVNITGENAKRKTHLMHQLVAAAFLPEVPNGCVIFHINGVVTDNYASNLGFITKKELGKKTGHISNAKAVVKIDKTGEFVDTWRSAREAAKDCFMSYQTIIDRCNGRYRKNGLHSFKSVFAPDGFAYSWDDEKHINKTLLRIQEELKDMALIVNLDGYDSQEGPEAKGAAWKEII
ncbi:MAG: HNH endonuclease [Lachnospiraceae bacterium]|nr:HNH endonuclease [Lachnospiraceae bacterium]